MAIWIPNQGEEILLDIILATNLTLKLYKTDVTAGLTTAQKEALTEANFTEATFTGYSSKALTGGSWVTTQAEPSTGVYAQQTFTSSANQTAQSIYGYYVTRTSDGKLLWFERFTGPISISLLNDAIKVTPTITLDDDQEATVAAQGLKASFVSTASTTAYTTTTTTDFVLSSFVADSTRNYKVLLHTEWGLSASGALWVVKLLVDGSAAADLGFPNSTGGDINGAVSGGHLWQPTSGTYTLSVQAVEVSGTASLTFVADSAGPREFWVEDIGPR
jgi:hypothetical protein